MASHAVRARKAEAALEGRPLDSAAIAMAAALVVEEASPADDAYATAWYRRQVAAIDLAPACRLIGESHDQGCRPVHLE